jgi:2-polyprenyl-3-methyl-5-hydroxy-6-metoxy-1,4-benzoquinol methylase
MSLINNTSKCLICGSDKMIKQTVYGNLCKNCGLGFKVSDISLENTPAVESKEPVYLSSKEILFKRGLLEIKKLLGGDRAQKQKPDLLDVGCGFGYFMKLAEDNGFNVEGIEISEKALYHSRNILGLKVHNMTLTELSLPKNRYDVVTLWTVLDVLPDPLADIKEIFNILKPGGIVYLRVNNFDFNFYSTALGDTLPFRILGIKPGIVHRWSFNRRSLKKLLELSSFEQIIITNSEPTRGDPYGTGGKLGSAFVQTAKTLYFILSQALYFATFGKLTISSSLIVSARKPLK